MKRLKRDHTRNSTNNMCVLVSSRALITVSNRFRFACGALSIVATLDLRPVLLPRFQG